MKSKRRLLDGILLLDKPLHFSSNRALQEVKRIFQADKAGHTGSLDPLATGMLPICFGQATKFAHFWLDMDKIYVVDVCFGQTSTTGDCEGVLSNEKPIPRLSRENLIKLLNKFQGEIEQVPPMYSALKHQGKPLYLLARQGIDVARKARKIFIHELQLQAWDGMYANLRVHCSKGTYIRSLVEDIGKALGCGAYVTALRRESVGEYQADSMVSLDGLQKLDDLAFLDSYLLPVETGITNYPEIVLTPLQWQRLRTGLKVGYIASSGYYRLYWQQRFVGLAVVEENVMRAKRLMRINPKDIDIAVKS